VPFKAKAASRHHIPRQKRRVLNWAEYDASLRQRGSLTIWFSEDAIAARRRSDHSRWPAALFRLGDPDSAVSTGVVSSGVAADRGVDRLHHRPAGPQSCRPRPHHLVSPVGRPGPRPQFNPGTSAVHLIVDSTGLKFHGPGEWLVEKHGTRTRRSWRKLHIGLDADTGQILASSLTTNDVDDGSQVGPLLDQVASTLASFTGDGAYDTNGVFAAVAKRHPDAAIIVPPRSTAVASETAQTNPSQRDDHLNCIAERGRMGWQNASGYNKRSRVETAIGRFKQVIGDGIRSRIDVRQDTEIAVAIHVLNRMLDFGRPNSVRIS
jgi:hypothetical protein